MLLATEEQQKIELNFAKSFVQAAVSRAMVDFILNRMNITGMIERIHANASVIDGAGMTKDELLFGTVNSEDNLNVPGGFTHKCIEQGHRVASLAR